MIILILAISNIIVISQSIFGYSFNYVIIMYIFLLLIVIILNFKKLPKNYNNINELKLIQKHYYPYKYNQYWFENNNDYNDEDIFISIYKTLINLDEFKLPIPKKVSLSFKNEDKEYFLHRPLDIKQNISLNNYLELIKPKINTFYLNSKGEGSPTKFSDYKVIGIKIYFDIRNLNKQNINTNISKPGYIFKNKLHTKSNKSYEAFKPIIKKNNRIIKPSLFGSMDLETIDFNGYQIPIAISFCYSKYNKIYTIFKIIDHNLINQALNIEDDFSKIDNDEEFELKLDNSRKKSDIIDQAVNKLFLEFYTEVSSLKRKNWTIFTHNLGSFDGYFIYKTLFELPDIDITKINTIVDNRNQFITINANVLNCKLVWKDSMRIFPVSLNELCKVFKVDGKFTTYKKEFNNKEMFKNNDLLIEFKKYAEQDSFCLLDALMKAQQIYIDKYEIDITSILSTSTLSMKIFRTKFLSKNIPILDLKQDKLIRESYFGGATDYYKLYGEGLYYYDVNSLYPYAMCNDIPLKFIKTTTGDKLSDVFGFLEVKVYSPKTIKTPFLPVRYNDQTIYPHGHWKSTYFSEELKQAVKYGYEIEILKAHHFTKSKIFNKYVNHFYQEKKISTGPERFIAKMHLNQLYGYFGRKLQVTKIIPVKIVNFLDMLDNYPIISHFPINKDIEIVTIQENLDKEELNNQNEDLSFLTPHRSVKSNVAIASAVTAYARMEMVKFKVDPNITIYYTDTDSLFVDKPFNSELVGDEIGLMKDELKGEVITRAYFLGIKKYGYQIKDKTHSVISGIPRNDLDWDELSLIAKGGRIIRNFDTRFYKHFNNLDIQILSGKVTISLNNFKKLVNNDYITPNINIIHIPNYRLWLKKIVNKLIKVLKEYNILK
uniref:DNA polymerase n=1 Tax=Hericium erinaceus TaxID=91752 RepID=UPI0021AC0EC8|nr:DNA polymerase [Hericium erinaceus]UUF93971.1 DNA polymerase [Hericium erinaceus]